MYFQERKARLEQEVASSKSISASLAAQVDGLKMVPTLFGILISLPEVLMQNNV